MALAAALSLPACRDQSQTFTITGTKINGRASSQEATANTESLNLSRKALASLTLPAGLTNLIELQLFGNRLTKLILPA